MIRAISALAGIALATVAQPALAQTTETTPCADKPPLECPYGSSGSWDTSINLKLLPSGGGQMACLFDRANMDPEPGPRLRLGVDNDARFWVCNVCDADVTVAFSWDIPWQMGFDHTNPPTDADGSVTFDVPCRDERSLTGYQSTKPEFAKGTIHVKLKGANFHDQYDPELEIEGGARRLLRGYGAWGVSGVLGLLALWALLRRRARS